MAEHSLCLHAFVGTVQRGLNLIMAASTLVEP